MIRSDNRFANLRDGTGAENAQNRKVRYDNISGLIGVSRIQRKWQARIMILGCRLYLGRFKTPELAYAAYLAAKRELHPFQPVPRAA